MDEVRGAYGTPWREFDLKVGDVIYAQDTILDNKRHKWKVTFISNFVFEAERVDQQGYIRGFRKVDYQQCRIERV